MSSAPAHTNRLAAETSPYLLQHQHNPVDWHAWGEEAFKIAREQDRPIFLSVGYSTCYWCHVMERESFENERVAREMNSRFVCIKVDREERPDVDQLYMAAVQIMTRHGGWPMSVFLTPQLRPFYGGTYFPVEDMGQRPGFIRVLASLEEAWKERRDEVDRTADSLLTVLHRLATPTRATADLRFDLAKVEEFVWRTISDFDAVNGGFGSAPKFPRETSLRLLLAYLDGPGDAGLQRRVREILGRTLDAMEMGGIHDHLGGGFHRYSTDERWLVPHFEVMLYDQAMLAEAYAVAARVLDEPRYGDVARGVCDFVLREMTGPSGEFYTAMDAEVDGREGLNYLWTEAEVREVLGAEDAALFSCTYGVDQGPNFVDPHHGGGKAEKSILFLDRPIEQAAFDHGIEVSEYLPRMASMRAKLKAVREKRKQPLLDTKVITGWNGLMAEALAVCGRELGESRYVEAAKRNVAFLLQAHRSEGDGLLRGSREGKAKQAGFIDDYASVTCAAQEAGMDDEAQRVAGQLMSRFTAAGCGTGSCGAGCGSGSCCGGAANEKGIGALFFTDSGADDLIVRQKVGTDSPLPAGNAQAAIGLLALGQGEKARAILAEFGQSMEDNAEGMSAMVEALLKYVRIVGPLEVKASKLAGGTASPEAEPRNVVQVDARFETETELWVRLTIAEGWHVYGPAVTGGLTATRLTMEGATVEYPEAEAFGELQGYSGEVILRARFATPPQDTLRGSVTYQACNESSCLAAVTREIEIEA